MILLIMLVSWVPAQVFDIMMLIWYDVIWYMICDLWYVICDMWYMIGDLLCDVWYVICDIWHDMWYMMWYNYYDKLIVIYLWKVCFGLSMANRRIPKVKMLFFWPDSPEASHPEIHAALHVFCISELVHVLNGPKATKEKQTQGQTGQTGQTDQLGWHRLSWGPILRDTFNFFERSRKKQKKDTVTTSKYTDLQITTGILLYLWVVWPALHILKSSSRTTRCHPKGHCPVFSTTSDRWATSL